MSDITLESSTVEIALVDVRTRLDPTGSVVQFQMSTIDVVTPAGTWTAGQWASTWDAVTGRVKALTPPLGAAPFTLTQGARYRLWVRWSHATETIVKECALVLAT
jgi:hypothetical protein